MTSAAGTCCLPGAWTKGVWCLRKDSEKKVKSGWIYEESSYSLSTSNELIFVLFIFLSVSIVCVYQEQTQNCFYSLASISRSINNSIWIYWAFRRQIGPKSNKCWDAMTDCHFMIYVSPWCQLLKKTQKSPSTFPVCLIFYSNIQRDTMLTLSSSFSFPLELLWKWVQQLSSI